MRCLLLLFVCIHSEFSIKSSEIFEVGVGFGYYHYFFLEGEIRVLFPSDHQTNYSSELKFSFVTDIYYSIGFGFYYDFGFDIFEYFKFGILYNLYHQKIYSYHQGAYFATCFLMLSLISNKFFEFGIQYTFLNSSLNKVYFDFLECYKKEDNWMVYIRFYLPVKKHFKAHLHLGKVSFDFVKHSTAAHEFGHIEAAICVNSSVNDGICCPSGGGLVSYKSSDPVNNVFIFFSGAGVQVLYGDSIHLIHINCEQDFLDIARIIVDNLDNIDWIDVLNPKNKRVKLYMCKNFFKKYANIEFPEMDMALQVFFDDVVLLSKRMNMEQLDLGVQILLDHQADQMLIDSQFELNILRRFLKKDERWCKVLDTFNSNSKEGCLYCIEIKLSNEKIMKKDFVNNVKIKKFTNNFNNLNEEKLLEREKQLEFLVKDGKIRVCKLKEFEKNYKKNYL